MWGTKKGFCEFGYTAFTHFDDSGVLAIVQPLDSWWNSDKYCIDLISLFDIPGVPNTQKITTENNSPYVHGTNHYTFQGQRSEIHATICSWYESHYDEESETYNQFQRVQPVQALDHMLADFDDLMNFKQHIFPLRITGYVTEHYSIDISKMVGSYVDTFNSNVRTPDFDAPEYRALETFKTR